MRFLERLSGDIAKGGLAKVQKSLNECLVFCTFAKPPFATSPTRGSIRMLNPRGGGPRSPGERSGRGVGRALKDHNNDNDNDYYYYHYTSISTSISIIHIITIE